MSEITHDLPLTAETEINWTETVMAVENLGLSNEISERANQIATMTTEGMITAISGLHSALAPTESHDFSDQARNIVDPDGTVTARLMNPEDRIPFFDYAVAAIKTLAEIRTVGNDQEFLNRAGNVLAMATVLAHPFKDGNGRVSRVLANTVRHGYDGTESACADLLLTGTNRPLKGFRVTGYLPAYGAKNLTPNEIITAAVSVDIPLAQDAAYRARVLDTFKTPYGH